MVFSFACLILVLYLRPSLAILGLCHATDKLKRVFLLNNLNVLLFRSLKDLNSLSSFNSSILLTVNVVKELTECLALYKSNNWVKN